MTQCVIYLCKTLSTINTNKDTDNDSISTNNILSIIDEECKKEERSNINMMLP